MFVSIRFLLSYRSTIVSYYELAFDAVRFICRAVGMASLPFCNSFFACLIPECIRFPPRLVAVCANDGGHFDKTNHAIKFFVELIKWAWSLLLGCEGLQSILLISKDPSIFVNRIRRLLYRCAAQNSF